MNHFQRFKTPAIGRYEFQIEYGESFGVLTRAPTPKNIIEEREFYVSRSGNVAFLVAGTLYPLEPGDAIMLAPHEYFHCIHYDNEPFCYYRILASERFVSTIAPSLCVASLDRKARFRLTRPAQIELYDTCEAILRDYDEASLFGVFHFFDILRRFRAHYTEDDATIEQYEICLPITLRKLIHYIRNHTREDLGVTAVAAKVGVSPLAAGQLFKEYLHLSLHEYVEGIRMAEATYLLPLEESAEDVAHVLQYKNEAYFSTVFKKHYGTTPSKFIRSHGIVYHKDL